MTFRFSTPTALEYFESLVKSDEQFPLLEAAASLAQDEYPELDVQQVLGASAQISDPTVDQLLGALFSALNHPAPGAFSPVSGFFDALTALGVTTVAKSGEISL